VAARRSQQREKAASRDSTVVFGETNPNFFNVYMGALKHDGGPTAKMKGGQSKQIGEWSRGSDLAKRSQFLEC